MKAWPWVHSGITRWERVEQSLEKDWVRIPLAVSAAAVTVAIEQKLLQGLARQSGRPAQAVVSSHDTAWQRWEVIGRACCCLWRDIAGEWWLLCYVLQRAHTATHSPATAATRTCKYRSLYSDIKNIHLTWIFLCAVVYVLMMTDHWRIKKLVHVCTDEAHDFVPWSAWCLKYLHWLRLHY